MADKKALEVGFQWTESFASKLRTLHQRACVAQTRFAFSKIGKNDKNANIFLVCISLSHTVHGIPFKRFKEIASTKQNVNSKKCTYGPFIRSVESKSKESIAAKSKVVYGKHVVTTKVWRVRERERCINSKHTEHWTGYGYWILMKTNCNRWRMHWNVNYRLGWLDTQRAENI